jgi:regulator of protease activity HflC (stomatin/prohibitin superfamily)
VKIDVGLRERAFVMVNGRAERYLGPGRHWVFRPFSRVQVERVSAACLLADLDAEQLALVPPEDLQLLTVAPHQRALVLRHGKPVKWLGPGQHQVWTLERTLVGRGSVEQVARPAVTVEGVDTSGIEAPPLRDDVRPLVPATDYVEATAPEGSVVLRYVDGVLEAVLPAGRHAAWTTTRKVLLSVVDLRERLLHVTGQEVMTKDRVSLRLNLSASFRVADARRLATVARTPDDVLYLAMQLAAREAVSTRTLDELLASRDALATQLDAEVRSRVEPVGLALLTFGVKDVILPGEMKALLNRVIEAQKEAEANVILRREETAATRSLAQTAKVLAENPLLVRLKELEAYKDLAGKVGQLHVVLGQGAVPTLQLGKGDA